MPFRTKKTRVYQYDLVVKGCRFRGSCGTEDYEEAKAVEAQIRADAKTRRPVDGSYTLAEALGTYHRDKMIGTPTESNIGSHAIIIQVSDGMEQVMQGFTLKVSYSTAVDDLTIDTPLKVYPNPSDGIFYFESEEPGEIILNIYNSVGIL